MQDHNPVGLPTSNNPCTSRCFLPISGAQFVNVAPNDLDSKIENAQRLICESLRVNHSSVWQFSEDNPDLLVLTHAYRDSELKPLPSRSILKEYFPWGQSKLLNREIICLPNTAKAPRNAATDMESWRQYGIRSTLAFPLSVGGRAVIGALAFGSTEERDWSDPLQRRLQILALVFSQALDRKVAETASFRQAAIIESSDDAIFSKTPDGVIVSWNKGAQRIYGYTEAEVVGKPITILFPPELLNGENNILERLRAGEHIDHYETVRVTKAGQRINISLTISPITDSNGKTVGFSGIAREITERKRAEEALSDMTRRLIEAQERERARIARELHDDINQRLALLAIELNQLRNQRKDLPPEVRRRVHELLKQTSEIATDVQTLSHELHSSKLDYLGVVQAMTSWCKEFGERQELEIDFKNHDVPKVAQEISLCLFRVLQEALNNAAKHSGVKRIEVQLQKQLGEIHLIVSDSGKGFDIEAATQSRGIGLTSMQERVRLVGGTIAIESKLMGGTTIHVRVPLDSKHGSTGGCVVVRAIDENSIPPQGISHKLT